MESSTDNQPGWHLSNAPDLTEMAVALAKEVEPGDRINSLAVDVNRADGNRVKFVLRRNGAVARVPLDEQGVVLPPG